MPGLESCSENELGAPWTLPKNYLGARTFNDWSEGTAVQKYMARRDENALEGALSLEVGQYLGLG